MSDPFSAQLEKDFTGFRPEEPAWLKRLRTEAYDSFAERGFPTLREEEWKYTSVEPLKKIPFRFSPASDDFASLKEGPNGAIVGPLGAALKKRPDLVEPYLGRLANPKESPFVALSTAFLADGVFVYLPRGAVLTEPIQVVHAVQPNGQAVVRHLRTLIVAEAESQASIVESYTGSPRPYLTNAVTEIVLMDRAVMEYTKLQGEGGEAYHIASCQVRQGRQSSFTSHSVTLGALFCRNDLGVRLEAEGAECTLNGLYLVSGRQHIDNHTGIDHTRPHGTSRELYKGILDGWATGVFNGRIVVRPEAEKTNARQTNKNLLLSDRAVVNTKPLLEILNNDVRCNHGATIGHLDENQIFYLRSRGLGETEARGLLIYAFASDVIDRMKIKTVRDRLQKTLFTKLVPGGLGSLEGL